MTKQHTTHTSKELLDAYNKDVVICWRTSGDQITLESDSSPRSTNLMLKFFITSPEEFIILDLGKPQPTIGQELTLEQLHDVEFMRRVKAVTTKSPYQTINSSCTHRQGGATWGEHPLCLIEYAITHKHVGWSVTVADVVDKEEG